MASLRISMLGPLELTWEGQPMRPCSHKALCLLVVLALRDRPVPREELAVMLWGPGRLRNLRQALYQLRQLPGSDQWLKVGESVELLAQSDLAELRQDPTHPPPQRGPFCEGIAGTSVALDDLLAQHQAELDSLLSQATRAPHRAKLARILAVSEPPMAVLERLLACSSAELAELLDAPLKVPTLSALERRRLQLRVASAWQESDPAAAAALWQSAGEANRAALAWEQAGELGRASHAAKDPALELRLALAWSRAGSVESKAYLQALALRTQDPLAVGHAALLRALDRITEGRVEEGLDAARAAQHTAQEHGLEQVAERAHSVIGKALVLSGQYAQAAPHFLAASTAHDPAEQRIGHTGLGVVRGLQGRLDEALVHHREALRLAREAKALGVATRALNNLGGDLHRLGRYAAAAARFKEATTLAEQLQRPDMETISRSNWVAALTSMGALGEARDQAKTTMESAKEQDDTRLLGLALSVRSELERACGRWEESALWSGRAASAHQRAGHRPRMLLSRLNESTALLEGGRPVLAEALLRLQAMTQAAEQAAALHASLELALWCPDSRVAAQVLERCQVQDAINPRYRQLWSLAMLRHHLAPVSSEVVAMAETLGPEQALACAVLERCQPGQGWVQAKQAALEGLSQGLLESQRQAMAERTRRLQRVAKV